MAGKAITAMYPPATGPDSGAGSSRSSLADPAASDGLSVDATSFLGGEHPQVGHPAAWERFHQGLLDLERALRAHGQRREVELTGRAHLTAAVAAGFIFRRPTGWLLSVCADDGACYPLSAASEHDALRVSPQPGTPTRASSPPR